jgi:HEAT repeat protein
MHGEKRDDRADDTVHIFGILDRSVAKSAVPKLTTYLNDSRHHYTAGRAAVALADIGDDGVPSLLRALEQPGHHALQPVMCALFWAPPKGTNATLAVNLLVRHTRDKGFMAAQTAVDALGAIATDCRISLPALTDALASEDAEIREAAASAIGKFGTNAHTALPALLAVLKDSSPRVQSSASNAVAMIQPKAFMSTVTGIRPN